MGTKYVGPLTPRAMAAANRARLRQAFWGSAFIFQLDANGQENPYTQLIRKYATFGLRSAPDAEYDVQDKGENIIVFSRGSQEDQALAGFGASGAMKFPQPEDLPRKRKPDDVPVVQPSYPDVLTVAVLTAAGDIPVGRSSIAVLVWGGIPTAASTPDLVGVGVIPVGRSFGTLSFTGAVPSGISVGSLNAHGGTAGARTNGELRDSGGTVGARISALLSTAGSGFPGASVLAKLSAGAGLPGVSLSATIVDGAACGPGARTMGRLEVTAHGPPGGSARGKLSGAGRAGAGAQASARLSVGRGWSPSGAAVAELSDYMPRDDHFEFRGDTLIDNPDFETGALYPWVKVLQSNSTAVTISTTRSHSTSRSMRMNYNNATARWDSRGKATITQWATYRFGVWVYADGNIFSPLLRIGYDADTDAYVSGAAPYYAIRLTAFNAWAYHEFEFDVTDSDYIVIDITSYPFFQDQHPRYIDDVSLVQIL